jgi:hypothetical protein
MQCRKWLLLSAFFISSWGAAKTEFLVDARYQLLRTRTDELVETVGWRFLSPQASLTLATRMNHAGLQFTAFDYAVIGSYWPLSWVHLHSRILHRNRLVDLSTTTTYFGALRLDKRFPDFLSYFIEIAIFNRRNTIGGNSVFPVIFGANYLDWDLSTAMGLRFHFSETAFVQASLATAEWFDVYNINNPYVELLAEFEWNAVRVSPYLRYQALLGFGLYDPMVAGVQFTFSEDTL